MFIGTWAMQNHVFENHPMLSFWEKAGNSNFFWEKLDVFDQNYDQAYFIVAVVCLHDLQYEFMVAAVCLLDLQCKF